MPKWIPLEKELKAKSLLGKGLSLRQIARKAGISHTTVWHIKNSSTIRVRKPRPNRQLRIPKKCDLCGATIAIWPCPACHSDKYRYDDLDATLPISRIVVEISPSEMQPVIEILKDLIELWKLNLIDNPLFLSLVERAEKIVNELLTKEEYQGATKKAA
jgi:transcriptional regulator with XRE-family HTH domain